MERINRLKKLLYSLSGHWPILKDSLDAIGLPICTTQRDHDGKYHWMVCYALIPFDEKEDERFCNGLIECWQNALKKEGISRVSYPLDYYKF